MNDNTNILSEAQLQRMKEYAAARRGADKPPMTYLYHDTDIRNIAEMVSKIAFVEVMKDFPEIFREDDEQMATATDPEAVGKAIGFYSYFVCMVNPAFPKSRLPEVVKASTDYYVDYVEAMMEEFGTWMEYWKRGFEDVISL